MVTMLTPARAAIDSMVAARRPPSIRRSAAASRTASRARSLRGRPAGGREGMTELMLAGYILNVAYRNNNTVRNVHELVVDELGGATVSDTIAPVKPGSGVSRGLVLLFAVACGVSVANLYYAQPLLDTIARTFVTNSGTAGLVVTLAQVGFAVGLALLVPLGDLVSRRRLVPVVLIITAAALVASALAPDIGVLIAVALIVGAGSVMAQ